MRYMDLYKKGKAINLSQIVTLSGSYEYLALRVSFFITPLFIMWNISANAITLLMLLVGLVSAGFIATGGNIVLPLGIFLFLFAQVLDATDGSVARMTQTSTFFGRFLDGVIDIIILCAIQLAFVRVILHQYHNETLMWVGIVSAVLTPFHHLYYDRYSAYARWINEENKMSIKPYIKRCLSPRLNWFLNDLHYTCLVVIAFLFLLNYWLWEYILLLYFLIHIGKGLFFISIHTKYAYNYMRVFAKQK